MKFADLSRRERQIMDIVYREGEATAADVQAALDEPPSYSAVRALLRVLVNKEHLAYDTQGGRHVYRAVVPRGKARQVVLENVKRTFFAGSTEAVVAALLDLSKDELTDANLDRLSRLIEEARAEGR